MSSSLTSSSHLRPTVFEDRARPLILRRRTPVGASARPAPPRIRGSNGNGNSRGTVSFHLDVLETTASSVLPSARWYEKGRSRAFLSPVGYERAKRFLDLTLCLLALPLVVVLLAVLAVAIRLDSPGPIFFVQHRTGRGGRRFPMLKLRTMVENADELKEKYRHLSERSWPNFKVKNDPRITRVGRILRRTSLDEVPQIFNILRGEMSLVGPRPTSFGTETYTLWQTARLDVTPGLSGLWQISGRSELDWEENLRLDIAYIRNRSLWLDVAILFRTVGAVVTGRGAI